MTIRKIAIIKVPPAMLADISNFCIGAYAQKILTLLKEKRPDLNDFESLIFEKTDKYIDEMEAFLSNKSSKMGQKQVSFSHDRTLYVAPINFTGWACPFGNVKQIEHLLISWGFDHINCELHFNSGQDFSGLWEGKTRTLQVNINIPKLESLEDFWNVINNFTDQEINLSETVEHELVHFVQLVGYYIKRTKDITGLPPRSVKDNKTSYISFPNQRKKKNLHEELPHDLEDAEFYPSLIDALNSFSRLVQYVPAPLKQEYLKLFIGSHDIDPNIFPDNLRPIIVPNEFFVTLQHKNRAKWNLAVKRFVNYIRNHPAILEKNAY